MGALTDTILSAPFEPGGWDVALKRLARDTHSGHAQLIAVGGPSTIPINWITDPAPGLVEELPLIDGGSPEINWRVACSADPLQLAWEDHYDEARQRLKSDVYDEFVERFDLPHGCQAVLLNTSDTFYGLAALRSAKDGRTTEADREVFAHAAGHVVTAVKLQRAMEGQASALIAGAFEVMDAAVFVCGRDGEVQALTRAAEAKLREPLGLRLVRNRLAIDRSDEDRALQSALRHVLDEGGVPPSPVEFWLRTGPTEPSAHRCEVLPLPRREWALGFEPRALVTLHSPAGLEQRRMAQLQALIGLTQAEAEIAMMAADGHSRDEIAMARGATVNTVGSQLKSIFTKADVKREAQLVALINRLLR